MRWSRPGTANTLTTAKRLSEVDSSLVPALPNPRSPSYPAGHVVAAGGGGGGVELPVSGTRRAFCGKGGRGRPLLPARRRAISERCQRRLRARAQGRRARGRSWQYRQLGRQMERQRADGTRKVEWDQPDSAADGDVEDLGSQLVEEFCAAPPSAYGSSENA